MTNAEIYAARIYGTPGAFRVDGYPDRLYTHRSGAQAAARAAHARNLPTPRADLHVATIGHVDMVARERTFHWHRRESRRIARGVTPRGQIGNRGTALPETEDFDLPSCDFIHPSK